MGTWTLRVIDSLVRKRNRKPRSHPTSSTRLQAIFREFRGLVNSREISGPTLRKQQVQGELMQEESHESKGARLSVALK